MGALRRSAIAALLTLLVPLNAASAHFLEYASLEEQWNVLGGWTWCWKKDTVLAQVFMKWSVGRRANLRHQMDQHKYRFTIDSRDLGKNLHANGWAGTNLPNPVFDRDDDDGDGKWEEGEYTAEGLPNADVWYESRIHFSHSTLDWWGNCSGYDPDGGTIEHNEFLSEELWWTADKWDTVAGTQAHVGSNKYPFQAKGAFWNTGPERTLATREAWDAASTDLRAADTRGVAFSEGSTDDPGEISLRADLSRGVQAYAGSARGLSRGVIARGPALGVLTFSRPVQAHDLERLSAAGLVIFSVEAVSDEIDGSRWSYSAAYHRQVADDLALLAADSGGTVLGVTSAEVGVRDAHILDAVSGDADVFLVDLSPEQARRAHAGVRDVVMNDLYWHLAGWAEP